MVRQAGLNHATYYYIQYYIGIIVILLSYYLYSITDDTSHPDCLLHKHHIISWLAATSSS